MRKRIRRKLTPDHAAANTEARKKPTVILPQYIRRSTRPGGKEKDQHRGNGAEIEHAGTEKSDAPKQVQIRIGDGAQELPRPSHGLRSEPAQDDAHG